MLCVDKTGTLTANQLELELILPLEGEEARARAAVALMVASSAALNKTSEAIAAAAPAAGRAAIAEVPFSSARKWSAVSLPPGDEPGAAAGRHLRHGRTDLPAALPRRERRGVARHRVPRGPPRRAGQARAAGRLEPGRATLSDEGDASVLPADSRPYALIVLRDVLRAGRRRDPGALPRDGRGRARHLRRRPGHRGHAGASGRAGHQSRRRLRPRAGGHGRRPLPPRGRADGGLRAHHARAQGAARGHLPRPGPLRGHDRRRRQRRALPEAFQPRHRHGQRQPGHAGRGRPHPHRRRLLGPGVGHRRGPAHPQRHAGHPARLPDAHPVAGHAHRLGARHRLLPGRPAQRLGHHALHGRHPDGAAGHLGPTGACAPRDPAADAGSLRRAAGGRGLLPGPAGGRDGAAHGRSRRRSRPHRPDAAWSPSPGRRSPPSSSASACCCCSSWSRRTAPWPSSSRSRRTGGRPGWRWSWPSPSWS